MKPIGKVVLHVRSAKHADTVRNPRSCEFDHRGSFRSWSKQIAAIGDSCVDNGGPHHQADNRLFHRFRIGRDANFWRRRLKSARPESRLPVVPSSYVQPVPSAIHAPPLTGGR